MKHDIAQLKQALPLDGLLHLLGFGEACKKSAKCPLHEDTRSSFSVYDDGTGELRWKCHAGCGGGDSIDFVQAFFGLSDPKAAIDRYAELTGKPLYTEAARIYRGKVKPHQIVLADNSKLVPAKLSPLTDQSCKQMAKWRGLDPRFVRELSDLGIFGTFDNMPAFKTEGGVHFRKPGDGWRYSAGAKASVLALGQPAYDKPLFIVESTWDALALYESSRLPVIGTRGAANAKLAIDFVDDVSVGKEMKLVCFPQNDKAGEDFAEDVKNGLMLHKFVIQRVPAPHKDFNDYYKATKTK